MPDSIGDSKVMPQSMLFGDPGGATDQDDTRQMVSAASGALPQPEQQPIQQPDTRGGMLGLTTTGGGLTSLATQYANRVVQENQFEKHKKVFENLMSQQITGAKAAVNDAVKSYGEDVKGWVPKPEEFMDEKTKVFMPYKYYQAFATGIKAYKQNKISQQKANTEEDRAAATAAHQEKMEALGQKNLDVSNRRADIAEQGIGVQAQRADVMGAQLHQLQKHEGVTESQGWAKLGIEQQRADTEKARAAKAETEKNSEKVLQYRNTMRQQLNSYANAFDEDAKKKALLDYNNTRRDLQNEQEKKMRIESRSRGDQISDEAIKMAIDVQNAADLQSSGIKEEEFSKMGNDFDVKHGYSVVSTGEQNSTPEAQRLEVFAQNKGLKTVSAGLIDEWLNKEPIEKVIQGILNAAKSNEKK